MKSVGELIDEAKILEETKRKMNKRDKAEKKKKKKKKRDELKKELKKKARINPKKIQRSIRLVNSRGKSALQGIPRGRNIYDY